MILKEREREKEERNKRVTKGKLHTVKGERELDNGKNHGYGKRERREKYEEVLRESRRREKGVRESEIPIEKRGVERGREKDN